MATARKKRPRINEPLNYQEGDWFEVPLSPGVPGVAVGVVARMDGRGGVLGYFFLLDKAPSASERAALLPGDADAVMRFGNLGLIQSEWPILGPVGWDRAEWDFPPAFAHQDVVSKKWVLRYRSDPWGVFEREVPTTEQIAGTLPRDGMAGSGAVEGYLSKLARQGRARTLKKRPLKAAKLRTA